MASEGLPGYYGYTGIAAELLRRVGAKPGDRIRVVRGDGRVVEGLLMPRYALAQKPIIVVKLDNGYNVGVRVDEATRVEVVKTREEILRERLAAGAPAVEPLIEEQPPPGPKPRVHVVATGGTIASRVDYETGGVKPAFTAEELLEAVPEIGFVADITAEVAMNIFSENMRPSLWGRIVEKVGRAFEGGAEGVVVTHGTDTMHYSAAAVAFATRGGLPGPVVFVGAQRSSDRPSSDAAFNLHAAVLYAARGAAAESVVCMHGSLSDTYALVHRGVKVRKMHTSRRDAFQSINARPLARVWPEKRSIEELTTPIRRRGEVDLSVENGFEERVALLKYYPGMQPEVIDFLVDRGFRGIVLEGTGLGHVGEWLVDSIRRAREEGVVLVMTSQCLFGRVNMNVYATGRKLLAAGVVPGGDMLPEVAFVKLSWLLARYSDSGEVEKLMRTNLVGELNPRLTTDLYPRWPQ